MSDVVLDTSDVDRWVGVPLGGGELREPVTVTDIRRWAQGMQNANPLYYDEDYSSASRFGRLLAPQSFAVACDVGHGATAAIQGEIPGSHMLFGGDEWWMYGPRILPGDNLHLERMLFDYRVTQTTFAGPTMFSRGDTTYINQRGEVVAKQRSTSIRYLVAEAQRLNKFGEEDLEPTWTDSQVEDVRTKQVEYFAEIQRRGHAKRLWKDVNERDTLPTRLIGPHTIQSFTTEWRAYNMNIWGAQRYKGVSSTNEAGWLPEMSRDERMAVVPSFGDGLYMGPSRGHTQQRYAQLIGMPRGYGYGASMGAWILDYLGNWAGEWGTIVHSNAQYRSPALTGDLTSLDGTVTGKQIDPVTGDHQVEVQYTMTDQREAIMAKGKATIALPAE
ncbi:MAG TPA: MaoC family dehydratase N-terminal domain-containing protein [Acidimicrobiales bacterium]|nr:MaoC family dehydratase N-terminal domain-containing protein [Acidimicrobiales bacterium]